MIHRNYSAPRKVAHPHCAKHKIKHSILKKNQNVIQIKAPCQMVNMLKKLSLKVLPTQVNHNISIHTYQNRIETGHKTENIKAGGDITGHKLFDSLLESSPKLKLKSIQPSSQISDSEKMMDIDVINSPTSIAEKKSVPSLLATEVCSDEPSAELKYNLKYHIKSFDEIYLPGSVQFPQINSTKIPQSQNDSPKITSQNCDNDYSKPIFKKHSQPLFNVGKAKDKLDALLNKTPQLSFIVQDLKRKLSLSTRIDSELWSMKKSFPNVHHDISMIQKKYMKNQSIDTDLHQLILKKPDLKSTVAPIIKKLNALNMQNLDQFEIVYSALKRFDIMDVLEIIFDSLYDLPIQKKEKIEPVFDRDRYFFNYKVNRSDYLTLFKDHFSNDIIDGNYSYSSFLGSSQTTVNHRQIVNNLLFTIDISRLHKISTFDWLTIETDAFKKNYFSEQSFLLDLFNDLKSHNYRQFTEKISIFNQFLFQDEKTD